MQHLKLDNLGDEGLEIDAKKIKELRKASKSLYFIF
jgi:hypothetical protein